MIRSLFQETLSSFFQANSRFSRLQSIQGCLGRIRCKIFLTYLNYVLNSKISWSRNNQNLDLRVNKMVTFIKGTKYFSIGSSSYFSLERQMILISFCPQQHFSVEFKQIGGLPRLKL